MMIRGYTCVLVTSIEISQYIKLKFHFKIVKIKCLKSRGQL